VEFGEWLCTDVLKKVPHRHFVFGIPKMLRRYFLYDRKLLACLSRCAWESLKGFPALEWLAAMCSHIPNKGEQMVRYYGHYSNVSRGKRKEAGTDEDIPCILDAQGNEKTFRRNWARLIQKIYEVNPLQLSLDARKMLLYNSGHQKQVLINQLFN